MPAPVTLGEMATQSFSATVTDIPTSALMAWEHGVAKAVTIGLTVATENLCYLYHGTIVSCTL